MAELLRVLERGERVGGLARLRHDDDECGGMRNAVAIAVLARDLDGARNARKRFDPLLRDERRIVAGAAREDQHAVDVGERRAGIGAEDLGHDGRDAVERVAHRARLLEDLLLHEVAIGAELDRRARRLDDRDRTADRFAARVVDRVLVATHVGDVAFLEVDDASRHRQQRSGVGCEEVIRFTDAHDERAAEARADDAARLRASR